MDHREVFLVYDKQCPVCNAYGHAIRISKRVGELKIVDARDRSAIRDEITARGLDIDQGMIVKIGDQLYYGADAIHALALMSSRSGGFNRLNYWIFSSKRLSAWLYPVLRSLRNLLLKMLGKTKINNLGVPHNDRF